MDRGRRRDAAIETLKLAFIAQAARRGARGPSAYRASAADAGLAELLAAAASRRGSTAHEIKAR